MIQGTAPDSPAEVVMPRTIPPPRLHLIPALSVPVAVILRRKPSKLYHVMLWHTSKDSIEHGSWFRGRLYDGRCDLSPDGRWMVYLAMGSNGQVWNGLCNPPSLTCALQSRNVGTWAGSGLFLPDGTLVADRWWPPIETPTGQPLRSPTPKLCLQRPPEYKIGNSEDLGGIFPRLVRDGFIYDQPTDLTGEKGTWSKKPTSKHPALRISYAGYRNGYKFRFELEGHDAVMSPNPDWACYDSRQQLLIAREGHIERWSLRDVKRKAPGFRMNLCDLEPPPRRSTTSTTPGE